MNGIPSPNGNHNAGDLHFGEDGKLCVGGGDGACDYAEKTKGQYENDASRDANILLGKSLRINPDGTIPADNPFTGPSTARCSNESGGKACVPKGVGCRETFVSGSGTSSASPSTPTPKRRASSSTTWAGSGGSR